MSNKPILNKMVSSVLNKDGEAFRNAFNDIAMDKIQTAIGNRTKEVATDIISSQQEIVSDDVKKEGTEIVESLLDASQGGDDIKHVCENGDVVDITQKSAKMLIELHDTLNKDNQILMRNSLSESGKEYDDMVKFAVSKIKG